jgi:hypothetical protein
MVWKLTKLTDEWGSSDYSDLKDQIKAMVDEESIDNFSKVIQIAVQPHIRDSLHLRKSYDSGRSVLSITQRLLEDSDEKIVKEWVLRAKLYVDAALRTKQYDETMFKSNAAANPSWLQTFLTAMKYQTTPLGHRGHPHNSAGRKSEGTFEHPVILEGPMGSRKEFNFPGPHISPRMTQICDYITMNSSKWANSPLMKRVRNDYTPIFGRNSRKPNHPNTHGESERRECIFSRFSASFHVTHST